MGLPQWERLTAFGTVFLLPGCRIQTQNEGLCLALVSLVMLCLIDNLERPTFFLNGKEKWIWGGGDRGGLGGVEKKKLWFGYNYEKNK